MYRLAALHSHPIQYFAPLYRCLAQEPDIDLTVYYCSHQGAEEYQDAGFGASFKWDIPLLDGYRYRFLRNARRLDRVAGFFSLINPDIVGELYRGRYDALMVHGHGYFTYLLGIAAAKVLGIPVLMRCDTHLLLKRSEIKRILRAPAMNLFYCLCDVCLPIGTRNAEFYRSNGVNAQRMFLVPYTVDNHYFAQRTELYRRDAAITKAQLGLPLDIPVILFASKLLALKRPRDLLQAYEQLRNNGIKAALFIVGSGIEEEALKSYIQAHHIPDVYFWGFQNQSELPRFYAVADLFVLPSENEAWGLIINEVMCAGLPVITTFEVGAAPDLVRDGYNGYVYTAGDTETLAARLRTLITNPDLRRQMGQNSRNLIANWDIEQSVNGIRNALHYVSRRNNKQALPS